jgi:CRISPR-associated protein Cmr2
MKTLFAFTFSPVQDFIAEARRAQDLLAGSVLLTSLSKAVLRAMESGGAELIYPPKASVPDAPNKLLVALPEAMTPQQAAALAQGAFDGQWAVHVREGHTAASNWLTDKGPATDALWEEIWQRQVKGHWQTFWAAAPLQDAHGDAVRRVNTLLDTAKRTRPFVQRAESGMKDTLSGTRSALLSGAFDSARSYWASVATHTPRTRQFNPARLRPEGRERLDALGVIKRFGVDGETRLQSIVSVSSVASADWLAEACTKFPQMVVEHRNAVRTLLAGSEDFFRVRNHDLWPFDGDLLYRETFVERRLQQEFGLEHPDPAHLQAAHGTLKALYGAMGGRPSNYYGVLVMDGDNMGARVDGCKTMQAHREFSEQLSKFAAEVPQLLAPFQGQVIYAGGDDVLALLPLANSIPCAAHLAETFAKITNEHVSAGIALVHHTSPLDDALNRARAAERVAKRQDGKNSLAVFANKRSGGQIEAVACWDQLALFMNAVKAFGSTAAGEPPISPKLASDVSSMASQFMPQSNDADTQNLNDGFARLCAVEAARHSARAQADLARKLGDDIHHSLKQRTPVEIGDWLLLARFVVKRGEE